MTIYVFPPTTVSFAGGATEATAQSILTAVDGIEPLLATIDADTSTMVTDVGTIKTDTALIKADVGTIKADTALIKADTGTLVTSSAATNTKLDTLNAKDFATSAKQDSGNTSLATIAGKDFATSAKQDLLQTQMNAVNKGFFSKPYDELSANYAGATTDVWTSKLATVTQQTLTITYADSTKAVITNVKVV